MLRLNPQSMEDKSDKFDHNTQGHYFVFNDHAVKLVFNWAKVELRMRANHWEEGMKMSSFSSSPSLHFFLCFINVPSFPVCPVFVISRRHFIFRVLTLP